ncbi:dual serine/threonine and tyrosine protein kinase-like [Glandiceps talaboti]
MRFNMEDNPFKAVLQKHDDRNGKVSKLLQSTHDFEEDMRTFMTNDAPIKLITEDEENEICKTFEQKISICVFGERNCGKSSLLNEMLGITAVPVSDTPCTCRVIRIKYSKNPYLCLRDENGTEIPGSRKQLEGAVKKEVKQVAALNNDDERMNKSIVSVTVEIGLDHPSLEHGVELIDSPGRNENKTLDEIVDKLVQESKKAILIYVIDGKNGLRPADRDTIQMLKDAGARDKLFYVCNKVDKDLQAAAMDIPSDEELLENDQGPMQSKASEVLQELRRYGLFESSDKFYGLSFKKVRHARLSGNSGGPFVEAFRKFKNDIVRRLDADLKTASLGAITTFLKCHARGFLCFFQKQQQLEQDEEELNRTLKAARQSERNLFTELKTLVEDKKRDIQDIVTTAIKDVSESLKSSAHGIKIERVRAHDIYLQLNLSNGHLCNDDEFCKFHTLCREVRNRIVNKVYNQVQTDVETLLEDGVAPVMWPKIIETVEALDNPILKRSIESIYQFVGYQTDYRQGTRTSLTKLLFSLVTAVKENLNKQLLQVYDSHSIMNMAVESYNRVTRRGDAPYAVVEKLTSRMDGGKLTNCILSACKEKMYMNHESFESSIKHIEFLKREVQINISEEVGANIAKSISKLALLEIQNHALKYEILRGMLEMGNRVAEGHHSCTYEYKPGWGLKIPELCVVRVIRRHDEAAWKRIVTALYYAFNCKNSEYLLRIYGWMFPDADTLSVVVDRVETSLEDAKLSPRQKLEVVLDVVKGIAAIHSSGFIYNNLDARNVLITQDGSVKINVCKGKYEILRGQAINLDIHHIGQLLLWLHDGERSGSSISASGRWRRPSGCSNDKLWRLIESCLGAHANVSLDGIIRDLKIILHQ